MFAKTIVTSDAFLDMPLSAQALYFHIGMTAKDKGISTRVTAIARSLGCQESDIDILVSRGFIRKVNDWTFEIVHWYENNGVGETAKKRNNYRYRLWRETVIKRDGHCVLCGSKEKLVAHHIKPFAEFPSLRTDIDNGVALCDQCHRRLHKEMRKCRT